MKNLIKTTIILFVFSVSSFACWQLDGEPQVSWVAFETPAKAGVKGSYSSVTRKGPSQGKDLSALLTGQSATLLAKDINTKNPARDTNIRESFFEELSKPDLMARIAKVTKKAIDLEVIMNGKKNTIPMTYEMKANKLMAKGHLDILDFQASKALKAINKRCFALHEGKTWSHVEIELVQTLKKCK